MVSHIIKSILCNVSYAIKLPLYFSRFVNNKVIVLMYHGITGSQKKNQLKNIYGFKIRVRQFKEQMEYLSKYCNVIKASDAIYGINLSTYKKNVVITFDDAYRNTYSHAFPILLKYEMPALFSIPTAFVAHEIPLWNDVIEYSVMVSKKRVVSLQWRNMYCEFELSTNQQKSMFIKWLFSKCVEVRQEKREQFIDYVLKKLEVESYKSKIFEDPDYRPLQPQEIRVMVNSELIEVASHSVNHFVLTRLEDKTLKDEVKQSKAFIETDMGLPCRYFCIPGGFYHPSTINVILNNGFERIFSSDYREFDPKQNDTVIGRYCITNFFSMPLFADLVSGPIHRMQKNLLVFNRES